MLFQDRITAVLGDGLGRVGRRTAERPCAALSLSLTLALGLGALNALGEWETRLEYTFIPRETEGFRRFEEMNRMFGPEPRLAQLVLESTGDCFLKENLLAIMSVDDTVLNMTAPDGSSFASLCKREAGACVRQSAIEVAFGSTPISEVAEMPQNDIDAAVSAVSSNLAALVGRDGDGTARALRMLYWLEPAPYGDQGFFAAPNHKLLAIEAWEEAFIETFVQEGAVQVTVGSPSQTVSLSTFGMAGRSITDEIANTVASSIPFMAGSLALVMLGLLVLLGGGSTCRESRVPLGLGAILTIELSIGAGFGLPAACGIPLTDFSMFIFFAAIGIGVDDVIVIVDGFDRTPKDMPVPDRVEAAMREGGVAIFLTSFTNFIAFLVASTIDFPCVRWFCLFSGSVLFFEFVFTITLFTSLLVLDERRRTRGSNQNITTSAPSPSSTAGVKGDLSADDGAPQSEMVVTTNDQKNVVVGVDVLPHDADTPGAADTTGYPRVLAVLQRTAVPVVTRPAGALIVVLVAAFAAGLSGAGASGIEMGIPLENNFLDTSYLTSLFDLLDHYWGSLPGRGFVVAKSLDYGTQQDVAATRALTSGFELDSLVLPPVESWLDSFSAWRDCTVTDFAYSSSAEEPLFTATAPEYDESASFEANLDQFLVLDLLQCNGSSTPPSSPSASATDLVRSSSGSVTVARYPLMVFISTTVPGRISAARQLRARWDTESDSVDGFVFSDFLLYADRDSLMWSMVASTLSFAAIAVLAVLALFIHPVHVVLTGLCLCVVNLLMLGLMRVWDIPIDTLSFIPLAMAIGMSVDYGTLSRGRWEGVECMF